MTLSTEKMRLYQRKRRANMEPENTCKGCAELKLQILKLEEQLKRQEPLPLFSKENITGQE